jgi:hypothetical protein
VVDVPTLESTGGPSATSSARAKLDQTVERVAEPVERRGQVVNVEWGSDFDLSRGHNSPFTT